MRRLQTFWLVPATLVLAVAAHAQDVRITFPQEGAQVRGQIDAQFEGVPAGGYAIIKVDGNFIAATSQNAYPLDTISDRNTFPRGDGDYKMEVTVMNPGGKRVGAATTTFAVANSIPSTEGDAVKLVHWTPADRFSDEVQRYRIFAESSANVLSTQSTGGGGGGGEGGGGGDGGIQYVEAPLDWQVSALLRRILRDTGMVDGAANVRTIVQDSFERQRKAPTATDAAGQPKKRRRGGRAAAIVMKAPWSGVWTKAAETGQNYVKMIQQNGTEINATRKAPTIAIGDLLPTFPDASVRPGSTWETTMTILGELSSRTPLNVRAPITFTSYETLQTPGGEVRRCAKLESRFRLPESLSKKIAVGLENQSGRQAGQATGGEEAAGTAAPALPGTTGGATGALVEEDIDVARSDISRVLWFDIQRNRVLRSEDSIRTYYETLVEAAEAPTTNGGDAASAAEPKRVSYNLNVTTWLDDRIPAATDTFNSGIGTAHSRDNVTDPPLSKILNPAGAQ